MKSLKKIIALCLVCILSLGTVAFADDSDRLITVFVDGEKINFDVNPVLENGRTLVPMRFIFEALGAKVSWDDATQTATAVKDDITIAITINKPELIKNGNVIVLDVPAKLLNDRTLVPVRAVSEGMEAKVEWIDETSQVIITTADSSKGSYSRSELSSNDMNKLKANAENRVKEFETQILANSSIGNSSLASKILAKDSSALNFATNSWNVNVVSEIIKIQAESIDTYEFDISGMTPEDAVKKATSDYVAIASDAGFGGEDVFKSAEYTAMNSGAVMLTCEYLRSASAKASYIGIVALSDGSIRYFIAVDSGSGSLNFSEVTLNEETQAVKTTDYGTVEGKDAFINSVNSKIN